jgi:hypothetical protein
MSTSYFNKSAPRATESVNAWVMPQINSRWETSHAAQSWPDFAAEELSDSDHIGKICGSSKKSSASTQHTSMTNLISFAFENHWQQQMLNAVNRILSVHHRWKNERYSLRV